MLYPQNFKLSRIAFLFALIWLAGSCKKPAPFSNISPPEALDQYVYAFTSGYISRASSIRVKFLEDQIASSDAGNTAENNLLSFSPGISGKLTWETPNTLRFDPDELLSSGKTYVANLALNQLFADLPEELREVQFSFRTQDQFFTVKTQSFNSPDPTNLEKTTLEGTLNTSDVASLEQIEKVLKARQESRQLPIIWTESPDQKKFSFTIEDIKRQETLSSVKLSWDGKALDLDLSGEEEVPIPPIGAFTLVKATYEPGTDPALDLFFSDPLDDSQNFDGLVGLSGYEGSFRYLSLGHQLRVFPSDPIAPGSHTLTVFRGIKNSLKQELSNPAKWQLEFEDATPQVRLASSGNILPDSEGLNFPFEAIGLKAVTVEVFKIYSNNILQFLQTNNLDGENELYRVGKTISRKKIFLFSDLETLEPNNWKRFSLDLKPLITQDPSAIYQIRLGFGPEDAVVFCGDTNENSTISDNMPPPSGENLEYSIMEYYYGPEGYYDGYNWQDRDDPCKPAYYNSDRFVSKNIMASNLGITAKAGNDKTIFVAVTDLRAATPVGGATLYFYDFRQQLIHTATTDNDGIVVTRMDQSPYMIIASQSKQKGYLRLSDGESLSLSKFDVGGAYTQEGLKGYIYGDRGVWRPGDSIYLNFVLDDKIGVLPNNYPISFEVLDARGQVFYKKNTSFSTLNLYPLHFATPPDAPTGSWLARIRAGGAVFEKILPVETIKPNRIKIVLDATPAKSLESTGKANITANWLHGAPATGLRAVVEYKARGTHTSFPKYPDFQFDDPARRLNAETQTIFEGMLDDAGKANFSFEAINNDQVPGRLRLSYKTTVYEKSGNFSTDNLVQDFDPFDSYCGLSIPANSWGAKEFDIDSDVNIALVSLDPDGKAVPENHLSIGVYKLEWRWWWDQDEDYEVSRYYSKLHQDAIFTKEVKTDKEGKSNFTFRPDEWGRYLVRICDTNNGHCAGDFFYAGSPWGESTLDRSAAASLPISTGKEKYEVGEKVSLNIQGSEEGKALITLENGSRVVKYFWQDMKAGDNTVYFEATADMTPNVYAHVTLIQAHAQVKNDLPIRLYGVSPVLINDPATTLLPKIKVPLELQPEKQFTVEVSEQNKKEMAYTLAIVDEGLLSLTRFQTPNPHASLYAREALGVKTWDVYDDVIGAFGARLERLLSIGGDGSEIEPGSNQQANRFKPVVLHLGPFLLKKGEKAKHALSLPNYIGEVRVMVVAANPSAYGATEASVKVKQPLMVLSTLPRVLSPGEAFTLPVSVFVQDPKLKQVSIHFKDENGLLQAQNSSTNLAFDSPGEKMAFFQVKVKDNTGTSKITINAEGQGFTAKETIEIQVSNPNARATRVESAVLRKGDAPWEVNTLPVGLTGSNTAVLEVSTIPPLNLGERLDYLLTYPYGCLEQTVSAAFAQMYLGKLLPLDARQKEQSEKNIRTAIDRLKIFRTPAGGFGYWPGNAVADPWGSTFAGHFLLEAKNNGYAIPDNLIDNWLRFQQNQARTWNPNPVATSNYQKASYQHEQAYRLFTLALGGKAELSAMNRMQQAGGLSVQANWRLATAYYLAGKTEVAEKMINELGMEIEDYREFAFTYGSRLRDRAMILEALTIMEKPEKAKEILDYLSAQLSSPRYLSTQEITYALLAVAKFVGSSDALSKNYSFSYALGNQKSDAGSNSPVFQISLENPDDNRPLRVWNNSDKTLFTRLIQTGIPAAGEEIAASNGINISVNYQDSEGKSLDPQKIIQGTDFFAKITLSNPGELGLDYENLALTHIFPSGWEIINSNLDVIGQDLQGSTADYREIRDDRVNIFFELGAGKRKSFYVRLNASYAGKYYLPAVICTAMYAPGIEARNKGQWVEVISADQ